MGCAPIHVSCCINFCIFACFGYRKLSRNPISGSLGGISNFFKAHIPKSTPQKKNGFHVLRKGRSPAIAAKRPSGAQGCR